MRPTADRARSTSLKKRLLSSGRSQGFCWFSRWVIGVGARVGDAASAHREQRGRAVKAGHVVAAGRGSLEGPVVMLSPATLELGRPSGRSWLLGGWAQRTCTIADRERSEATLVRGRRHPFVPCGRMVVSGHSQDGLIQFPGHARSCGGRTSILELASWLCPNLSSGLPVGQTADLAVA